MAAGRYERIEKRARTLLAAVAAAHAANSRRT
jgi:hypothetical protein